MTGNFVQAVLGATITRSLSIPREFAEQVSADLIKALRSIADEVCCEAAAKYVKANPKREWLFADFHGSFVTVVDGEPMIIGIGKPDAPTGEKEYLKGLANKFGLPYVAEGNRADQIRKEVEEALTRLQEEKRSEALEEIDENLSSLLATIFGSPKTASPGEQSPSAS